MSNLIYSTYRDLDVQFFLQALLNKSFRFLSVRCDRAKCCILYDHFMKKLGRVMNEIRTDRQLQI
jgi:hypothetical protein